MKPSTRGGIPGRSSPFGRFNPCKPRRYPDLGINRFVAPSQAGAQWLLATIVPPHSCGAVEELHLVPDAGRNCPGSARAATVGVDGEVVNLAAARCRLPLERPTAHSRASSGTPRTLRCPSAARGESPARIRLEFSPAAGIRTISGCRGSPADQAAKTIETGFSCRFPRNLYLTPISARTTRWTVENSSHGRSRRPA